MYTLFFDNFCRVGKWKDVDGGKLCTTRVSVDDVIRMDGTSMTILLSENENAGHWIWYVEGEIYIPRCMNIPYDATRPTGFNNHIEDAVAFCYPGYREWLEDSEHLLSSVATGEIPTYIPLTSGTNDEYSPLFINEGRANSGVPIEPSRTARPSSGHPGGVVAAFCDGSVRYLKEDMDKTLFVRLCRPGSGVILNPKDLD
jgi:prepilin-type processing-associated H-X9-DG protein